MSIIVGIAVQLGLKRVCSLSGFGNLGRAIVSLGVTNTTAVRRLFCSLVHLRKEHELPQKMGSYVSMKAYVSFLLFTIAYSYFVFAAVVPTYPWHGMKVHDIGQGYLVPLKYNSGTKLSVIIPSRHVVTLETGNFLSVHFTGYYQTDDFLLLEFHDDPYRSKNKEHPPKRFLFSIGKDIHYCVSVPPIPESNLEEFERLNFGEIVDLEEPNESQKKVIHFFPTREYFGMSLPIFASPLLALPLYTLYIAIVALWRRSRGRAICA